MGYCSTGDSCTIVDLPIRIHRLFPYSPFKESLLLKCYELYCHSILLVIFYGISSKDCPIKREELETVFLVMIQPLSSFWPWLSILTISESYFLTDTMRESECLNPNDSS